MTNYEITCEDRYRFESIYWELFDIDNTIDDHFFAAEYGIVIDTGSIRFDSDNISDLSVSWTINCHNTFIDKMIKDMGIKNARKYKILREFLADPIFSNSCTELDSFDTDVHVSIVYNTTEYKYEDVFYNALYKKFTEYGNIIHDMVYDYIKNSIKGDLKYHTSDEYIIECMEANGELPDK